MKTFGASLSKKFLNPPLTAMDGQPFIVIHSVNTPEVPFPATVQALFTPLSSVLYYKGKVSDTFRSETWLSVKHPHVNRRLCKIN